MKKPKKLKHPKKPSSHSSLETLQNYLKKCKEIDRENKKRETAYNKFKKLLSKIKGY